MRHMDRACGITVPVSSCSCPGRWTAKVSPHHPAEQSFSMSVRHFLALAQRGFLVLMRAKGKKRLLLSLDRTDKRYFLYFLYERCVNSYFHIIAVACIVCLCVPGVVIVCEWTSVIIYVYISIMTIWADKRPHAFVGLYFSTFCVLIVLTSWLVDYLIFKFTVCYSPVPYIPDRG